MKKTLLSAAVSTAVASMVLPSIAHATVGSYGGGTFDQNIEINAAVDVGIYASDGAVADYTGQSIVMSTTPGASWGRGNVGVWAASATPEQGRTTINLGKHGVTDTIEIRVNDNSMTSNPDIAIGIWALGSDDDTKYPGGLVNINTNNLIVDVTSANGWAYGISAQNNTTSTVNARASIVIDAENIVITASGEKSSDAIVGMSQGMVEINGNLKATAKNAITARGDAVVNINKNRDKTVQLTGDINFNYDGPTSGTKVDASVNVNLTGADSFWNGNTVVSYNKLPSNAAEGLLAVRDMNLGLYDSAQWTPVYIAKSETEEANSKVSGSRYNALTHLDINGGIINLNKELGNQLTVERLTGTGGTLNVEVSRNNEGVFTVPVLNINAIGEAPAPATFALRATPRSGTVAPTFQINAVGITADDVTDAGATFKTLARAINTGTAERPTTEGVNIESRIAEGDIQGAMTQTIMADGTVGTVTQAANTKLLDYEGVNATALVLWRNEINHLTKRMGDLRANEGELGAWARVYGGENKWSADTVVLKSTTIQVGGDMKFDGWYVGGALNYTDSTLDLANGDGDGDSWGVAAYATRLFESGLYTDVIARYGHLKNDITSGNMDLTTKQNAFGLSGEVGWHFQVAGQGYVEPQFELTYGYVEGDKATASNGVTIDQDAYQNLIARVGVRTGFDFPAKAGTFYAHASYNYDFLGEAEATASKGSVRSDLKEDLGGGWFSYGLGAQFAIGKMSNAYVELERTAGGEVETPWKFNVGARWNF